MYQNFCRTLYLWKRVYLKCSTCNNSAFLWLYFLYSILSFSEHGILRRLHRRHKRGCFLTCDHNVYSLTAQTFRELFPVYAILSGGICAVIMSLLAEKLRVNTIANLTRPSLDGFMLPNIWFSLNKDFAFCFVSI